MTCRCRRRRNTDGTQTDSKHPVTGFTKLGPRDRTIRDTSAPWQLGTALELSQHLDSGVPLAKILPSRASLGNTARLPSSYHAYIFINPEFNGPAVWYSVTSRNSVINLPQQAFPCVRPCCREAYTLDHFGTNLAAFLREPMLAFASLLLLTPALADSATYWPWQSLTVAGEPVTFPSEHVIALNELRLDHMLTSFKPCTTPARHAYLIYVLMKSTRSQLHTHAHCFTSLVFLWLILVSYQIYDYVLAWSRVALPCLHCQ